MHTPQYLLNNECITQKSLQESLIERAHNKAGKQIIQ